MPARAVMVTSSFLPGRGGIESFLSELAKELSPRLAVLAPPRRDGQPLPHDLDYETVDGPTNMLVPRPVIRRSIVATTQRLGTNKVLFGTPWPLCLLAGGLKRRGIHYAIIVHGAELLVPAAIPGLSRLLARILSGADLLLPVSEFTRSKMERMMERSGLPIPPTHLLRARVDLQRFSPAARDDSMLRNLGVPQGRKILCFGRLVKRKGVDRAIKAMPRVRSVAGDVSLVIAGTGPELDDLKKIANGDESIHFVGRVPDEAAPALYACADIFTLPVIDRWGGLEIEGLGVVLLEASACGTPCVTGRSGGTPEAVVHERTGLVVDAADDAALADAYIWMLSHPEEARAMGQRGRSHVEESFGDAATPAALVDWVG